MSSEIAYGRYTHGGPGPCWIAPTGTQRMTPTVSEARTMLTHWVADRAAKASPDAASYKASIKDEKSQLQGWLASNPEVQAVYRQAAILTQMGLNPIVEIVTGDDGVELRISLR